MTSPKSLPARPSLESLRKQAKKLAREITAGNAAAIARARVQLPKAELPLSRRDAQLVVAREYGYAGWQDLSAEVARRCGHGVAWAASQAERIIHDNHIEGLKQLLAEYPALLTWGQERGGVLAMATGSYGDSLESWCEKAFTRRECAELLVDSGAVIVPMVPEGILRARARELLQAFQSRRLLPRTLKFLAALGDLDGVRACFDELGRCVQAQRALAARTSAPRSPRDSCSRAVTATNRSPCSCSSLASRQIPNSAATSMRGAAVLRSSNTSWRTK